MAISLSVIAVQRSVAIPHPVRQDFQLVESWLIVELGVVVLVKGHMKEVRSDCPKCAGCASLPGYRLEAHLYGTSFQVLTEPGILDSVDLIEVGLYFGPVQSDLFKVLNHQVSSNVSLRKTLNYFELNVDASSHKQKKSKDE